VATDDADGLIEYVHFALNPKVRKKRQQYFQHTPFVENINPQIPEKNRNVSVNV
jgi:hypothetical protein